MDAALLGLAALACPLGMLAMMGGMWWMSRRSSSHEHEQTETTAVDAREATHA